PYRLADGIQFDRTPLVGRRLCEVGRLEFEVQAALEDWRGRPAGTAARCRWTGPGCPGAAAGVRTGRRGAAGALGEQPGDAAAAVEGRPVAWQTAVLGTGQAVADPADADAVDRRLPDRHALVARCHGAMVCWDGHGPLLANRSRISAVVPVSPSPGKIRR